jgi:hypothetical protein
MARVVLLAAAAFLAGGVVSAQAQTPSPGAAQPNIVKPDSGKQAEDAAACKSLVRSVYARPDPRTVTLTDDYGRRAEGLIGTIGGGRFPGLYIGREEREQYRYCMYQRGSNPDE